MNDSLFPKESRPASTPLSPCPTCGSRMESKIMRQSFSIWTAAETTLDEDSYQTVERAICVKRCSVCGYEEYELPEA